MCWHIIGTLQGMLVVGLVLWNQAVEDGFHINPHVWITVLIDAQSATGMFCEDIDDTSLRQLRQLLAKYLTRHKMEVSRLGL